MRQFLINNAIFFLNEFRTRVANSLLLTRERIRLVNGTITIVSKPMGGTTIQVCVPLDPEHGSQRLAV